MISNERIEVTNQPAHIDEDIKDSLFEAFVTGGKSEAGHGLGLYVAKYFAELSGFSLTCENTGDKVAFTIKRKEEPLC